MNFPFQITRKYKLPDSVFADYKSEQIIEIIYNELINKKFRWITKDHESIKFAGNQIRWYFYFITNGPITHCVDSGVVEIKETTVSRTLIYTFQIYKILGHQLTWSILFSVIVGFIFKSILEGLIAFGILIALSIVIWLLFVLIHPLTVSQELEILRYEIIKKRREKTGANIGSNHMP